MMMRVDAEHRSSLETWNTMMLVTGDPYRYMAEVIHQIMYSTVQYARHTENRKQKAKSHMALEHADLPYRHSSAVFRIWRT